MCFFFFFSSRRRHTRFDCDWSSDVCSSDLGSASVLLAEPCAALWLGADGRLGAQGFVPQGMSFLAALETWWLAERRAPPPTATGLAFEGGWAVFLGYELAQEIEPHLALPRSPLPWAAFALRTPCALVHDLQRRRVFAVAEAHEIGRAHV